MTRSPRTVRTVGLSEARDAVLQLVHRAGEARQPASGPPVVLVDGRSGAGKSVLAALLVAAWPEPVELIRLDDLYPGWGGLRAGSEHLRQAVLEPRSAGAPQRWQRWDWVLGAPGAWSDVDPDRPLIVEGCGALSAGNRALADVGVWVDAADRVRKDRALARDGDAYLPYWDMWAAQEESFLHVEDPRSRADLIVQGDG